MVAKRTLTKPAGRVIGLLLIPFTFWLIGRLTTVGIPNVFSRERIFVDSRPLSEDVAIEVSKKSLQASGYDVTILRPQPLSDGSDQAFERYSQNEGAVTWWSGPGELGVKVRLLKEGNEIRCRAYRQK